MACPSRLPAVLLPTAKENENIPPRQQLEDPALPLRHGHQLQVACHVQLDVGHGIEHGAYWRLWVMMVTTATPGTIVCIMHHVFYCSLTWTDCVPSVC
jgi:hypothetical protein